MRAVAEVDRSEDDPAAARSSLADARECLAYWERRARELPLLALRRRREARATARRWQARVAEAERAAYGAGMLGALALLAAERRLPQPTREAGRRLGRRLARASAAIAVVVVAVAIVGVAAAVELLAALIGALT